MKIQLVATIKKSSKSLNFCYLKKIVSKGTVPNWPDMSDQAWNTPCLMRLFLVSWDLSLYR